MTVHLRRCGARGRAALAPFLSDAQASEQPRLMPASTVYYGARFASQAGQALFFAFLLLVTVGGSSGTLGLSSVIVASTAAALVLSSAGGSLVDRLGPQLAIQVGALLRLGAIASGFMLLGHGEYAWAVAFVYSAASQVYSPAEMSLVAAVGGRQPAAAHTSLVALQFGGQGAALALAPALYFLGGSSALAAGAVLAFLVVAGAMTLLAARLPSSPSSVALRCDDLGARKAMQFFGAERPALYAVSLLAFTDMATRSLLVAAPVYLRSELGLPQMEVATLALVAALGALLGLVLSLRGTAIGRSPPAMRLLLVGMVVSFLALALLGDGLENVTQYGDVAMVAGLDSPFLVGFLAGVPVVFLLGLSLTASPIVARTVVTTTAPSEEQGRIFAAQSMLSSALIVPALLMVGLTTNLMDERATWIVIGAAGGLVIFALESLGGSAAQPATILEPSPVPVPIAD